MFRGWILAAGLSFTVAAAPPRVVSLSPAVTEMVLSLDGRAQLAGRSSACDQPEAAQVPVAGDLGRPFVEPVLRSGAQVVLTDMLVPGPQWDVLKKFGLQVELFPAEKVDDLPVNLEKLGRILGCPSRAGLLAAAIRSEFAALRNAPVRRRVRALVVLGLPPVVSCGRDSFVTDALALAGLDNIAAEFERNYFILSTEVLHRSAPEVIISFVPEAATRRYFSRSEYRDLPAVKAGRFLYPPIEDICRLTPRLPGALRRLRSRVERDFQQQPPQKTVELPH